MRLPSIALRCSEEKAVAINDSRAEKGRPNLKFLVGRSFHTRVHGRQLLSRGWKTVRPRMTFYSATTLCVRSSLESSTNTLTPNTSFQASETLLESLSYRSQFEKRFYPKRSVADIPLKATLPIYVLTFFYCSSRTLILILDMIQLCSFPFSAFDTVNWGTFFTHFS